MPHKADELHVKEMDNLLRLLLICQVCHNKLTVVRGKSLVYHQRVINLIRLVTWLDNSLNRLIDCWRLIPVKFFRDVTALILQCAISFYILIQEGTKICIIRKENWACKCFDVEIARLATSSILFIGQEGLLTYRNFDFLVRRNFL